jgi:hypothetical protein
VSKVSDLVWRGRIQLGDEPGIYSDAQYGGLCLDLPVELFPYDGQNSANLEITVEASEVKIYQGYKGHPVAVFGLYEHSPGKWSRKLLAESELGNSGKATLQIKGDAPRYICVRVQSNSELPPGLYDEVVVERLTIVSETHYGYLGFRANH